MRFYVRHHSITESLNRNIIINVILIYIYFYF